MELDPSSITGDWANIEGQEYYVYTSAKMLGFCIIGQHEPCFSVSAFFAKNDDNYESQYEKFSSLLFDLKQKVQNISEGGEQPMNEFENQEVATPEVEVEVESTEQEQEQMQEPVENKEVTDFSTEEEQIENSQDEEDEVVLLQIRFNELQTSYNELQEQYKAAQDTISNLEIFQASANTELDTLRNTNAELQATIQTYEAQITENENHRKDELINKYADNISEQELAAIREGYENYSYAELESKLALAFAHEKMNDEVKKVPIPEPQESQFALLMKKYRKN